MLYQIGPATIDTFPFSIDAVKRETGADWAPKDLVGRRRGREYMGEGDEKLQLSGTIFPYNQQMTGAALILDVLHGLRMAGLPIFVLRGDFMPLGWWVLEKIDEEHSMLAQTGVGQIIKHTFNLTRVSSLGFDAGYSVLGTLINLFGGDFGLSGASSTGAVQDVWFSGGGGIIGDLIGGGLTGTIGGVIGGGLGGLDGGGGAYSDPNHLIDAAFNEP